MKKILLILGMTNFIAIETSLIISCSDKLTKPIERPKQATNLSQCGNSCRLEFAGIQNSVLILIDDEFMLDFYKSNILLPDDLLSQKQFYLPLEQKTREIINFYKQNGIYKKINDYRVGDEIYEVDSYFVDEISNVKILFGKYSNYYRINDFSAQIPDQPKKDKEQVLPVKTKSRPQAI